MLKRFVFVLSLAGALTTGSSADSPASINLLLSTNAAWTADVGNSTCTFAPRSSGDSLVATWKVDSGGWNTTWVSLVATLSVSLSGADSIKILYKNNNANGFSLRLTMKDGTMWQSLLYLNGLSGLQLAAFALNAAGFPQQFATGGTFSVDSIKSISFVNNTNPTTLTAAGVTGVYTITQVLVTKGSSSVERSTSSLSLKTGSIRISSDGFSVPRGGEYAVSVYRANGACINTSRQQCAPGFNRVNFSKNGSGIFIAKVSGKGFSASSRLVIH